MVTSLDDYEIVEKKCSIPECGSRGVVIRYRNSKKRFHYCSRHNIKVIADRK